MAQEIKNYEIDLPLPGCAIVRTEPENMHLTGEICVSLADSSVTILIAPDNPDQLFIHADNSENEPIEVSEPVAVLYRVGGAIQVVPITGYKDNIPTGFSQLLQIAHKNSPNILNGKAEPVIILVHGKGVGVDFTRAVSPLGVAANFSTRQNLTPDQVSFQIPADDTRTQPDTVTTAESSVQPEETPATTADELTATQPDQVATPVSEEPLFIGDGNSQEPDAGSQDIIQLTPAADETEITGGVTDAQSSTDEPAPEPAQTEETSTVLDPAQDAARGELKQISSGSSTDPSSGNGLLGDTLIVEYPGVEKPTDHTDQQPVSAAVTARNTPINLELASTESPDDRMPVGSLTRPVYVSSRARRAAGQKGIRRSQQPETYTSSELDEEELGWLELSTERSNPGHTLGDIWKRPDTRPTNTHTNESTPGKLPSPDSPIHNAIVKLANALNIPERGSKKLADRVKYLPGADTNELRIRTTFARQRDVLNRLVELEQFDQIKSVELLSRMNGTSITVRLRIRSKDDEFEATIVLEKQDRTRNDAVLSIIAPPGHSFMAAIGAIINCFTQMKKPDQKLV